MTILKNIVWGFLMCMLLGIPCKAGDIHKAAMTGNLEKVRAMITDTASLVNVKDEMGRTPLHLACYGGHIEVVKLLLTKGADLEAKLTGGVTALFWAVSKGHIDIVKLLIERGADVNIQEDMGYTPVYVAAFRGNKEMLQLLISKGANLNLKNSMGTAPLLDMAREGKKEIVSILLANNADLQIEDGAGNTALQLAANHGQKDVVELLCQKGANLNRKGKAGDTPIHGAAWNGDKETVEWLIAHKADINVQNDQGNTPLDNARLRGHNEIETFLANHKGKGRKDLKMTAQKTVSKPIDQEGISSNLKFTILYDNYVSKKGTKADWGFSCLIEGTEKVILFDTGTRPKILFHNINHLGVDLKRVQQIVISHEHHDHIGGLATVLDTNHNVSVYLPVSFPYEIVRGVENKKAKVVSIDKPTEICPNVYSTGEMGDRIKEQSLIINTVKGLIIVTGCSHQGIVNILKRAKELFAHPIYLVFGGYHLGGMPDKKVEEIIKDFKQLGVKKCGATHCTGDRAINLFKKAFAENYVSMGTGKILEIKQ